jgi:FkbM family methyltransferase
MESELSFISYAQNFEDVMLMRALGDISRGFYIDIGAQDPIVDFVSLAFYELGWRGIHVEPNQYYADRLRQARADEVVLPVLISDVSGDSVFYEVHDTGLSTAVHELASTHAERGFEFTETTVKSITLDQLFDIVDQSEIHWLKIDVEGFEQEVLSGWVNSPVRPWVVVIESTLPNTQIETFDSWEDLLTKKNYLFAYFDGLNRFYIHADHENLLASFSCPPNVFDSFVLRRTAIAENRAQEAEVKAQEAENRAQEAENRALEAGAKAQEAENRAQEAENRALEAGAKAQEAENRALQTENALNVVYSSHSWRITSPLRGIGIQLRRVRHPAHKLET